MGEQHQCVRQTNRKRALPQDRLAVFIGGNENKRMSEMNCYAISKRSLKIIKPILNVSWKWHDLNHLLLYFQAD